MANSMIKELIDDCSPILYASVLYADLLNNTSMSNHISKVINYKGSSDYKVAPYCYFTPDYMDYEPRKGNKFIDELRQASYLGKDKEAYTIDLDEEDHIINFVVPTYFKKLPKGPLTKICGLIGVPIIDNESGTSCGDHFVAYAYDDGNLFYFDSAIDENFAESETFKILKNTFNPTTLYHNTRTFESAGGMSENPYSYVGQNIFCHSWCLWFLHELLVKKNTMANIDLIGLPKTYTAPTRVTRTGKPPTKTKTTIPTDKINLILIKKWIYTKLIPLLEMELLYKLSIFGAFPFILNGTPTSFERITPSVS